MLLLIIPINHAGKVLTETVDVGQAVTNILKNFWKFPENFRQY